MRDVFIIIGCWAISFLFNGIEAGLTSIDPVRLRHHVKLNRPAAVRLDRLLKKPERLLVTVLLITNLVDILALLLLSRLLILRFGFSFESHLIWPTLPLQRQRQFRTSSDYLMPPPGYRFRPPWYSQPYFYIPIGLAVLVLGGLLIYISMLASDLTKAAMTT